MNNPSATVYGIDLGTTFSCIARIDEYGRPEIIPNANGLPTTPSVVYFENEGQTIVGQDAKNNLKMYPERCKDLVKRDMGVEGARFLLDGKEYTPEEISSYILRKLVKDAEQSLGGIEIKDVVITCPAYFGVNERDATAKAGEIAGLNVRSIINEPTAAAIAYGMSHEEDQTVLVYDLGGGTFDITMIDMKGGPINLIATGGERSLGGRNWDEVIVNFLANELKSQAGTLDNPLDNPETVQELFQKAEDAKITLTNPNLIKTNMSIHYSGHIYKIVLTREQFDEMTAPLLERTIDYTKQMLEEAKQKGYSHFDQILLVGGSTRMPQVAARIKKEFGIEPKFNDPDQAVAKGAAIYGQKLMVDEVFEKRKKEYEGKRLRGEAAIKPEDAVAQEIGISPTLVGTLRKIKLTSITSHTFGVKAKDSEIDEILCVNLIFKNDKLPQDVKSEFGTDEANMENAEIVILESDYLEKKVPLSSCKEIKNAMLSLPLGLPAKSPIEITFQMDTEGRLHVTAVECTQGRSVEVDVQTEGVITQEELAEAKERSSNMVVL